MGDVDQTLASGRHQSRGVADLLEVEPITLCRMIDRLEEAGLVERRRDPNDRRAWRIFLTTKARPIIDQLQVIAEGLFEDALTGLDDEQRAALGGSLTRIHANLVDAPQTRKASGG